MKIYSGKHTKMPDAQTIFVRDTEDMVYSLKHIVKHSPDGMNFGYGGSGPSDTALSILTDCIGKERAERLYPIFKNDYVATWKHSFSITSDEIEAWADEKELSF